MHIGVKMTCFGINDFLKKKKKEEKGVLLMKKLK